MSFRFHGSCRVKLLWLPVRVWQIRPLLRFRVLSGGRKAWQELGSVLHEGPRRPKDATKEQDDVPMRMLELEQELVKPEPLKTAKFKACPSGRAEKLLNWQAKNNLIRRVQVAELKPHNPTAS